METHAVVNTEFNKHTKLFTISFEYVKRQLRDPAHIHTTATQIEFLRSLPLTAADCHVYVRIPDPRLLASDYDNLTAHIEEFTRILTSINHAIIPHNSSEDLHLLEKTYGEESCRLNERWESFRRRGWSNLSDVDTLSTAKEKYDAAWKSYLESGKGWKDNYMQTLKECIDRTHVAALVIEQLRETGNTYLTELVRRVSSDCLESYEELRVYNGGTEHELSSIVIPPFERTHPKFDEKYREWIRIRPEVVAIRNFAQSLAKSRGQSSNQGSSSLSEN